MISPGWIFKYPFPYITENARFLGWPENWSWKPTVCVPSNASSKNIPSVLAPRNILLLRSSMLENAPEWRCNLHCLDSWAMHQSLQVERRARMHCYPLNISQEWLLQQTPQLIWDHGCTLWQLGATARKLSTGQKPPTPPTWLTKWQLLYLHGAWLITFFVFWNYTENQFYVACANYGLTTSNYLKTHVALTMW